MLTGDHVPRNPISSLLITLQQTRYFCHAEPWITHQQLVDFRFLVQRDYGFLVANHIRNTISSIGRRGQIAFSRIIIAPTTQHTWSLVGTSPQPGVCVVFVSMSQPSPSVVAAIRKEMEDIMSEITFQKVLLSSIDDSVHNREAAENEVRAEIKSLEDKLRDLKRSTTTAASNSQLHSSSQYSQAPSSNSSPRQEYSSQTSKDKTAPESSMDSYPRQFPVLSALCTYLHLDVLLSSPISLQNPRSLHSWLPLWQTESNGSRWRRILQQPLHLAPRIHWVISSAPPKYISLLETDPIARTSMVILFP